MDIHLSRGSRLGRWIRGWGMALFRPNRYAKGQLGAANGQISRYRVALGIDKASHGSMVELTNNELHAMAGNLIPKIRQLCSYFGERSKNLGRLPENRKSPEAKAKAKAWVDGAEAIAADVTKQYDQLRSDEVLLNNEILRRLDPSAAAAVMHVPLFNAQTGTPLSLTAITGHSGIATIDAATMCMAADETERLAKLLPPDHPK